MTDWELRWCAVTLYKHNRRRECLQEEVVMRAERMEPTADAYNSEGTPTPEVYKRWSGVLRPLLSAQK